MDKRFWVSLIVIVLVLGGIFWFTGGKKTNAPGSAQATNHIEGQGSAHVTLIEYGDYECPFCAQYYPIVKQVESAYAPYIFFQFRNLPLSSIHPNAFAGARAAEAAALQNKFWEMHDLLYQNQSQWSSASNPQPYFNQIAQAIGLNVTKFQQDFASQQVNDTINADMTAFNNTGAQESTPSFFLDGQSVQPNESFASFQQLLNNEIKKKTGTTPTVANPNSSQGTTGSTSAPRSTQ